MKLIELVHDHTWNWSSWWLIWLILGTDLMWRIQENSRLLEELNVAYAKVRIHNSISWHVCFLLWQPSWRVIVAVKNCASKNLIVISARNFFYCRPWQFFLNNNQISAIQSTKQQSDYTLKTQAMLMSRIVLEILRAVATSGWSALCWTDQITKSCNWFL